MNFEKWFDKNYSIDGEGYKLRWAKVLLHVYILLALVWNVTSVISVSWYQGIPSEHVGSVIYIRHQYNKWYDYNWTDVEMLTYSGDTHHVQFWDHPELEIGVSYEIHVIRDYRRQSEAPWRWPCFNKIVSLEIVDTA